MALIAGGREGKKKILSAMKFQAFLSLLIIKMV